MSDSLTVVVHLPQTVDNVVALLKAIAEIWPDAVFTGDRVEVPRR